MNKRHRKGDARKHTGGKTPARPPEVTNRKMMAMYAEVRKSKKESLYGKVT